MIRADKKFYAVLAYENGAWSLKAIRQSKEDAIAEAAGQEMAAAATGRRMKTYVLGKEDE